VRVSIRHSDRVAESDETEAYVERVLSVVERIPAGRVVNYGLIAEYVGWGGPRQVGQVMAMYGSSVPWWRVVRADGSLPESHQREALPHYREEQTPLRGSIADTASLRVDIRKALWTDLA
jgi:alkylated DNA nucleotide flippase Atl1